MYRLFIFALIAMIVAGCVSFGSQKEGSKASWKYTKNLEKGVSTKKDVLALIGTPDQVTAGLEGGEIYIYKYSKTDNAKVGLFLEVGGASKKSDSLCIFFDKNGTVTDYFIKYEGKPAK